MSAVYNPTLHIVAKLCGQPRAKQEIPANFDKLRTLLTHLGESCLFCQQAQNINVDALFLLSHMLILHDRQLIK